MLTFLEDNLYFLPTIVMIVAFLMGYYLKSYIEKKRTKYEFTEKELKAIARHLWEKGRANGVAKSPIIPTQEYLDSVFSTHLHECIKYEVGDI